MHLILSSYGLKFPYIIRNVTSLILCTCCYCCCCCCCCLLCS